MVLQLGGCGRVGDCRNNFCGEGPVRVGRGPFLYSWVLFIHGRGCCLPPFRCGRGARDGFCAWDTPTVCGPGGRWQPWPLRPQGPLPTHRQRPLCRGGLTDQRPKSLENSPFFFGFSAGVSSSAGAAGSESVSEGVDSPAVSSVALGAESVLS